MDRFFGIVRETTCSLLNFEAYMQNSRSVLKTIKLIAVFRSKDLERPVRGTWYPPNISLELLREQKWLIGLISNVRSRVITDHGRSNACWSPKTSRVACLHAKSKEEFGKSFRIIEELVEVI